MLKEKLKELLEDMSVSDLVSVHNEYCRDCNMCDDEIYEMDMLDELLEGVSPWDVAKMVFYGEFNPNAEYFRFNGYGNLESMFNYQVGDHIYIEDIVDHIITTYSNLYNLEIEQLIKEYEDLEESTDRKIYYEVGYKSAVFSFDSLEEAIEFADKSEVTLISEIGGSWDDYEKCAFCGEWFISTELNKYGDCSRCESAILDHGGY